MRGGDKMKMVLINKIFTTLQSSEDLGGVGRGWEGEGNVGRGYLKYNKQ